MGTRDTNQKAINFNLKIWTSSLFILLFYSAHGLSVSVCVDFFFGKYSPDLFIIITIIIIIDGESTITKGQDLNSVSNHEPFSQCLILGFVEIDPILCKWAFTELNELR